MSQHPRENSGGKSRPHHVEQEIIKINTQSTRHTGQATAHHHNEIGAPAAEEGQNKKEIEPNSMSEAARGKRKFPELLGPVHEHHIGLLQAHVAGLKIKSVVDQDSTNRLTFPSGIRRRKIDHSDPVRWKIKSELPTLNEQHFHLHEPPASTTEQHLLALQAPPIPCPLHRPLALAGIAHHAGGSNSSELGVNASNINMAMHHVAPALTPAPAPAPAIINSVVTVRRSSTDQSQNSRSAAGPSQLDPVVFEPGFLTWDQVKMRDEAHRRNRDIQLYPSVDKFEEIN